MGDTMTSPEPEEQQRKMTGEKARRNFYLLAVDWVHLHIWLPTPPRREFVRHQKAREFGHPAEWASDRAAEIAAMFSEWHDLVAEHRNETAPPKGSEECRVVAAWKYLEPRFEQLVELVDAEALGEIAELHRRVRSTLGLNNPPQNLPIPCPNVECGLLTLQRIIGVGRDFVACGNCDYTIKEEHYPFLVRMSLDTLIDAA
jgi:hypothetical protein